MSFVAAGTYVFRLTASDGTNPPVSDTVTLTVVNPPPVVNAGADQTVQLPASASLDGTVTDDGLTLLTTTWSVLSGPGTVTFGNPNSVDTTATFGAAGTYVLRLTANDTVNTVSDDVTIIVTPATLLYFSTLGDVNVGGLGSADDADVYAWFGGTTYSRVFDASANGVPAAADVDALVVVDSDTLYVSFLATTTLPGVGAVASQDVVKLDAGTWSMFFDGSDVGLTTAAENVDAFEILSGTAVAVSTTGNPDVPGITGEADEDLLQCTGTSFGNDTVCAWSFYFDGERHRPPGRAGERGRCGGRRRQRLPEHHRQFLGHTSSSPARTRTSSRATAALVGLRPRARASRSSSTAAPTASPTTSTRSTDPRRLET